MLISPFIYTLSEKRQKIWLILFQYSKLNILVKL